MITFDNYILFYIVFCFILALTFFIFLIKDLYKKSYIFIFLLVFLLTVLNPVFSSIFFIFILKQKNKTISKEKVLFEEEDNIWAKPFNFGMRRLGEASVSLLPEKENVPLEIRLELINLLNQYKSPWSIRIVENLLKDKEDEVRLLGYSVLDKLETRISKKVEYFLDKYHGAKEKKEKAILVRNIAYAFWDFLYYNLVDTEMEKVILKKIEFFLEEAKKVLPKDPYVLVLLGRMALRQGKQQEAIFWLSRAKEYGASNYSTIPYLAEAFFALRDFTSLKKIANEFKEFVEHPKLGLIWRMLVK